MIPTVPPNICEFRRISMSSVNSYGRSEIDINTNTCLRYLCISISSVTPTGDRNKYKLEISMSMWISTSI